MYLFGFDRPLTFMDMKRIHSGRLRAIGYDARGRQLQVELDDGTVLLYANVGGEIWRRLSSSGSAWSYYRDNIEEEFAARRITGGNANEPKKNPLDDLWQKP